MEETEKKEPEYILLQVDITPVDLDMVEVVKEAVKNCRCWEFNVPRYAEGAEMVFAEGVGKFAHDMGPDEVSEFQCKIASDLADLIGTEDIRITTHIHYLSKLNCLCASFGDYPNREGLTAFDVMYGGNWKETTINLKRVIRDLDYLLSHAQDVKEFDAAEMGRVKALCKKQLDKLENSG